MSSAARAVSVSASPPAVATESGVAAEPAAAVLDASETLLLNVDCAIAAIAAIATAA